MFLYKLATVKWTTPGNLVFMVFYNSDNLKIKTAHVFVVMPQQG